MLSEKTIQNLANYYDLNTKNGMSLLRITAGLIDTDNFDESICNIILSYDNLIVAFDNMFYFCSHYVAIQRLYYKDNMPLHYNDQVREIYTAWYITERKY